jgi:hypothetical protein
MKRYAFTLLSFLAASSIAWAQIPDPKHNQYSYLDTTLGEQHEHRTSLQPKVWFGLGDFNYGGDISDSRNNGLIGRTGMQIGLSANINDYFDAAILMEEGIVRVDGLTNEELPENFMSSIFSIGIRFSYNFKNVFKNNRINPFVTAGISHMKFDSKGSNDMSSEHYEIDLLDYWLLQEGNTERYSQSTFDIPLGIGLNFSLNERANFNISTSMHLTGTDYIDNIVNGGNDSYTVSSAAFVYDLFCYECEEDYYHESHDDYLADVNFDVLDKEDSDRDGVIDLDDFCPNTPKDVKVDILGCPADSDGDAIPDYKDEQENTPEGAIVNNKGVQLTDEMGAKLFYAYANAASRSDADAYFAEAYPTEKFVKITKTVVTKKGDTLEVNVYKPKIIQMIEEQQRKNIDGVTPGTHIDLKAFTVYKVQIAMHDKGMKAELINKLMSIPDLKSTIEGKTTIYTSGEFYDVLEARQYKQQLANKGYINAFVLEDNQGDLRTVTEAEMDREESKRTSALQAELPPVENVVFRVQMGVFKEVDADFFDLDDLILFEGTDGFTHVFSGGFHTYEDAMEHKEEIYFLGYDEAKVVALKDGELVNVEDYMDLGTEKEKQSAVFGDVKFQVQLGLYGANTDEGTIAKIEELEDVEMTDVGNGLSRYTVGNYTNLQSALMKHAAVKKLGYEGAYVIAFFNGEQISLKKAQELIGF